HAVGRRSFRIRTPRRFRDGELRDHTRPRHESHAHSVLMVRVEQFDPQTSHRSARPSRVRAFVLSCLLAIPQLDAGAQRVTSSIEIGAASMRYADSINAAGASISPALALLWTSAKLRGTGTFRSEEHTSELQSRE